MHQPLPEAFLHLSEKASSPFRDFFRQVAIELQQRRGRTAEDVWKENLKKYLTGLHISKQEMEELEKLGSILGYLDVEMQVNALDYYLEQLELSSVQAQESVKDRKRLYQYMGMLGGIALSILIF